MALETGTYISDLVVTNPTGSDPLAFADDHLRLVKSTIKSTFPNIAGAVTKTHTEINNLASQTDLTNLQTTLNAAISSAVAAAKEALYPVGSIYVNATNATNPGTLLGFGTWVEFGAGRVLVGQNASDTLFDTLEETGGSKDAVVVSHTHTYSGTVDLDGAHNHTLGFRQYLDGSGATGGAGTVGEGGDIFRTGTVGVHGHNYSGTTNSTGSSGTNANVQPYIVVKMWKRTA
jgi:hypothetical protein